MAIPFRIKDDEQDKAREIVPEKVSETIPSPALWGESGNEQVEESESFVGRLLHELVGVYLRLCSSGRSSSNGVRTRRSRNENGLSPTLQTTPSLLLPDLIPQFQLPLPMPQTWDRNLPQSSHVGNPEKINSSQKQVDDDRTFKTALDTKMNLDFSYQRTDQSLKRIGNSFELTNSTRRRHTAGNHGSAEIELSLELELELSLLIPATLLSLFSFALWKSRLS